MGHIIDRCIVTFTISIKIGRPSLKYFDNHVNPRISAKWYPFGIQLGIPDYALDEIKANNPGDVRSCCREALKYWLTKNYDASWEKVLQALQSESISERTLAEDIEKKLLSGTMYILQKSCQLVYTVVPINVLFCCRRC